MAGAVKDDTTRSPPILIVRGDVLLFSSASGDLVVPVRLGEQRDRCRSVCLLEWSALVAPAFEAPAASDNTPRLPGRSVVGAVQAVVGRQVERSRAEGARITAAVVRHGRSPMLMTDPGAALGGTVSAETFRRSGPELATTCVNVLFVS